MSEIQPARVGLGKVARGIVLAAALVFAGSAAAQAGQVVNAPGHDKLALKGFDAVAYFTDGKPVEGAKDFEYRWMNAVWRFASAAHRDSFAAGPEKFAPQYGGYCAYAVSQGGTADIDPEAWKIVDGKLYLNLSKPIQARWSKDVPGHIAAADANWPKIKAGLEK
jgi:hypothetical protein